MSDKKKFLKYKEGDIEYIREDELKLKELLCERGEDTKNKLKAHGMKDYLIFMLVVFLIGVPIMFYYYYLKPVNKEGNNPDESYILEQDNDKEQDLNLRKEKNNKEEVDESEVNEFSEAEIREELAVINNRNIDKLNSYFDNKSNRIGLKSVLEKSLKEQKDLYVKVETHRIEHTKNSPLLDLQETILADIKITLDLINMTENTISKNTVKQIYSKYN